MLAPIAPDSVLGLPSYSSAALPAVLAEVGVGMTGQPYELFSFTSRAIVPVKMTFPIDWLPGLTGGGAAEHGQGAYCSSQGDELLLTQVFWSGPGPTAPTVTDRGGGESPAPGDHVVVRFERWTLEGQPLRQLKIRPLPPKLTTYAAATAMENAHC
jgi:hypothetical protein